MLEKAKALYIIQRLRFYFTYLCDSSCVYLLFFLSVSLFFSSSWGWEGGEERDWKRKGEGTRKNMRIRMNCHTNNFKFGTNRLTSGFSHWLWDKNMYSIYKDFTV